MTTAAQKTQRQMICVSATPAATKLLNKLAAETGMNKRRIVLLSLQAFDNLNDEQRKSLNIKHSDEIVSGGGR